MFVRKARTLGTVALLSGLMVLVGCGKEGGSKPDGSQGAKPAATKDAKDHGHTHERGKMLIADAGPYHALLTAHLSSKDGNELDIFFETATDKDPRPVALPIASFQAQAKMGEELKVLQFEPAPADERPKGEKEGTCSHFVAKAPWMKPADTLYVVVKLAIDGEEYTVRWKDFNPKKYAHHED